MITANFSAYGKYVTDSLTQWDTGQVLRVAGLNLSAAPEVHFSNANMDRAIVRQATLSGDVVSVEVPNSLLQDPLRIKAHICTYEGDTCKVIELVEIPVKPRKRPLDYVFEDTQGEVYSYKKLENMIENITETWFAMNAEQVQDTVTAWLDDHPEATTTVQDGSLTLNKFAAGELGYVTPEMFGAKGDGVTDDTEAIQQALNNANVVSLASGKTYLVSSKYVSTSEFYALLANDGQHIRGNGATLKLKLSANQYYAMLRVANVSDVVIEDVMFVGDLDEHTNAGAMGFGVNVCGNSSDIKIKGCTFSKMIGDGICVDSMGISPCPNNITIDNCVVHHCRRLGVSLINGENIILSNAYIHDISGTDPQAGVDVESSGGTLKNVQISNLTVKDCAKGLIVNLSNGSDVDIVSVKGLTTHNCGLQFDVRAANASVSVTGWHSNREINTLACAETSFISVRGVISDYVRYSYLPSPFVFGVEEAPTIYNLDYEVDVYERIGSSTITTYSRIFGLTTSGVCPLFENCSIKAKGNVADGLYINSFTGTDNKAPFIFENLGVKKIGNDSGEVRLAQRYHKKYVVSESDGTGARLVLYIKDAWESGVLFTLRNETDESVLIYNHTGNKFLDAKTEYVFMTNGTGGVSVISSSAID